MPRETSKVGGIYAGDVSFFYATCSFILPPSLLRSFHPLTSPRPARLPSASFELTRGFQSLYNTASLVGIGFLVACGGFWYITIRLLPRLRGYHLVDET